MLARPATRAHGRDPTAKAARSDESAASTAAPPYWEGIGAQDFIDYILYCTCVATDFSTPCAGGLHTRLELMFSMAVRSGLAPRMLSML